MKRWIRYQGKYIDRYLKLLWLILIGGFITIWILIEGRSVIDIGYKLGLAITTIGSGDITPNTAIGKLSVVCIGILVLLTLGRIITRKEKVKTQISKDSDIIIYANSDTRMETIKNIMKTHSKTYFSLVFDKDSNFKNYNIFELENSLMMNENIVECVQVHDILMSVPTDKDWFESKVKVVTLCNEEIGIQANLFRNLAICSLFELLDSSIFTCVEVLEHKDYFQSMSKVDQFVSWNQGDITSLVLHNRYIEPNHKTVYLSLTQEAGKYYEP